MRHLVNSIIGVLFFTLVFIQCKDNPAPTPAPEVRNVTVPVFNQDSAYAFVEKQLSFGYRVPGTDAHKACKEWMVNYLRSLGADVEEQVFKASFYTANNVDATNIIARFNPGASKRIMLSAHWDSRIVAEKDTDVTRREDPIPGADDSASGVAVVLELARTISQNPIDMGIDIVLFDAEDQGDSGDPCQTTCSWCQGSQYWSQNIRPANYSPEYGILLDMVGAKNASFYKEGYSMIYAQNQVDKIWTLAQRMGYSDFFIDQRVQPITDDHRYVNTIAKIPMLDIINLKPDAGSRIFDAYHHTHDDNIDVINKRTLRVVGQVVTAVLYKESGNSL